MVSTPSVSARQRKKFNTCIPIFSALILFGACQKEKSKIQTSPATSPYNSRSTNLKDLDLKLNRQFDGQKLSQVIASEIDQLCHPPAKPLPCSVKNQGPSHWCNAFSPTDLLTQLTPNGEELSVMDYIGLSQSKNSDLHFFRWVEQSRLALEKLQKRRSLLSEKSFPFDLLLVEKLERELDHFFAEAKFSPEHTQGVIRGEFYRIQLSEERLTSLRQKHKRSLEVFKENYGVKRSEISSLQHRTQEQVFLAPFSIVNLRAHQQSMIPFFKKLFPVLATGAHSSYVVCGRALHNLAEGIANEPRKCGPHKVNIVQYRRSAEGCQFLLKNSWGPNWADTGHTWVELSELLEISPTLNGNLLLEAEFLKRLPNNTKETQRNEDFDFNEGFHYQGGSQNGEWHGKGKLTDENSMILDGTFHEGSFISGKGQMISKNSAGEEFISQGSIRSDENGKYVTDGKDIQVKTFNGKPIFKGTMKMGEMINGQYWDYYQNPNSQQERLFYEGDFYPKTQEFRQGTLIVYEQDGSFRYSFVGTLRQDGSFLEGLLEESREGGKRVRFRFKNGTAHPID